MSPTVYPNEHGDSAVRADILRMIRRHEATKPRSLQAALGPSQVGHPCDRSLGWQIEASRGDGESGPGHRRSDPLPAIVGTAVHAWLEEAAWKDNLIESSISGYDQQRWTTELEVVGKTPGGIPIGGSIDLLDNHTGTVIDYKVLGNTTLKKIKTQGPGPLYETQIQVYGYLLECSHGLTPQALALCLVPRNGPLGSLQLLVYDYDRDLAADALRRYDSLDAGLATDPWDSLEATPEEDHCRYCPVPLNACPEGIIHR